MNMMNRILITEATKVAYNYLVAEGLNPQIGLLRAYAINWYNHTDITDVDTLAAAVMLGDFNPDISYDEVIAAKEIFFPSLPLEYSEIHISDIEEALRW